MPAIRTRGRVDPDIIVGKPRSDAYTGLLGISLGAMILGCVLLYLDFSEYGTKKPPALPRQPEVKALAPTAPPEAPAPAPAPVPAPAPAPVPATPPAK